MIKSIVFFNRSFYEYDREIQKKFESNGYRVLSFSLIPQISSFRRYVNNSSDLKKLYSNYQNNIVHSLKNENGIVAVFVLAGQGLLPQTILQLRDMFPTAFFLWYIWDSIRYLDNYKTNNKLFDKVLTFDPVEGSTNGLDVLPLFYQHVSDNSIPVFDISMVAVARDDRFKIVNGIYNKFENEKTFFWLCTGYKDCITTWIKQGSVARRIIHPKPLPYKKTLEVMRKSKCVMDIPAVKQTGLTMRTIETLGVCKKLITTNKSISNYDFYNRNNIYIADRERFEIPPKDFFDEPYNPISKEIHEKYSLDNWIRVILREMQL